MPLCQQFFFVLAATLLPWRVCGGFVDMDTPLDKRTTKSLVDNTVYHLVGSLLIHVKCTEKLSNQTMNRWIQLSDDPHSSNFFCFLGHVR